jgi:hypothetical protein
VIWNDDPGETAGFGYMGLTSNEDNIRYAWHHHGEVGAYDGVTVNVRRAIFDPYYTALKGAEVLRFKERDGFDSAPRDEWLEYADDPDMMWGKLGSLYQTFASSKDSDGDGFSDATERIRNRIALSPEDSQDLQHGGAATREFVTGNNLENGRLRDLAVTSSRMVVSNDWNVPIPEDVYTIDGHLYQVRDDGDLGAGWVPLESPYLRMDGRTFEVRGGDLVELNAAEIEALPEDTMFTRTSPLGTHPVHGPH